MASSGWPYYSRFGSFPDMFSFSLDPEVLSFLWTSSPQRVDIDAVVRYHISHPSQLLQIFFSGDSEETSLLSTLHYTVVTTGILVAVGVGSYCTFKLLQCIRQGSPPPVLQSIKTAASNITKQFVLHWRRFKGIEDEVSGSPVCHANSNGKQICRRPSELLIVTNGSPRGNSRLLHPSRESSLERRLLFKDRTPLADCDIASGEEDINDIQGQYFGPTVGSKALFCMELMGSSSDDSPTHALSPYKEKAKRSPKNRLERESSC